jgi:hypothetical protein
MFKKILRDVKKYCRDNNIKIKIEDAEVTTTPSDVECQGYFDNDSRILCVCKNAVNAYEVLIHEFCHAQQFIEAPEFYEKAYQYGKVDACTLLDLQQKGHITVLNPEIVLSGIMVELDCEHRALAYFDAYDLPDKEKYIKTANSILYSYAMIYFFNKQFPKLSSDAYINIMPTELKNSPEEYLDYKFNKYLLDQIE